MHLNSIGRFCRLLVAGTAASFLFGCGGPNGDVAHGKVLYAQCAGCHKLAENSAGPKHCGLIGRAAGTVADFEYSEAMKTSELVWDVETLDAFLTAPIAYVAGTKMGFAGLSKPTDRADLIAYLQQATSDPAVCPQS
jgi:cytochrome c